MDKVCRALLHYARNDMGHTALRSQRLRRYDGLTISHCEEV